MGKQQSQASLGEIHNSVDTTAPGKSRWRRVLAFFGPAYLVSVGYMDPGNWATGLAGGSQFGYSLLWVLVMSSIMGLLLQSLSARLGIVRNRDLAQANRETYPKKVNFVLYILAEVAIVATDLAEILGMAIGLQLLTGMPLIWGVAITALDTFLLMTLQKWGMRKLEAFIIGLIFVIGMSFLVQIWVADPNIGEIATGLIPHIQNDTALYIAIGIIGATVMPHNLYLHSALVQTRKFNRDDASIKKAIKLNFWDSAIALNMALLVNAAILILAATVFYKTGRSDVAELKQAYELLPQHLGSDFTAKLFAVALIAAGQSSTITGTLAGQIVMEGYLRFRMNPLLRRLITRLLAIVPAALVILINGEGNVDSLLIFSQVVLSMQLGFAVIPLIHFVSDKKTMGKFAIKPVIKIAAWVITIVLVYLNSKLLVEEAITFFATSGNIVWKGLIILSGIGFIILLAYTTLYPLFSRKAFCEITPHDKPEPLLLKSYASFNKIAITVDFKQLDQKVINYAITQGGKDCTYTLIHVVESVASASHLQDSTDEETVKDREFLDEYVKQLQQQGYHAEAKLGFGKTADSIGEIVNKSGAELIVMGAHGHKGLKDLLYGATINQVRHLVKIPVLVIPAIKDN